MNSERSFEVFYNKKVTVNYIETSIEFICLSLTEKLYSIFPKVFNGFYTHLLVILVKQVSIIETDANVKTNEQY